MVKYKNIRLLFLLSLAAVCACASRFNVQGLFSNNSASVSAIQPNSFGMEINTLWPTQRYYPNGELEENYQTSWPNIPFGTLRLWDTDTYWFMLEPTANQYVWDQYPTNALDTQIAMALNHGSDILYTFGGVPHWSVSNYTMAIQSISRSYDGVNNVVTITTTAPHGLIYSASDSPTTEVTVTGIANDSTLNLGGTYTLNQASGSTLTYYQPGTLPPVNSTGSGSIQFVCTAASYGGCTEPPNLTDWHNFVTNLVNHLKTTYPGQMPIKYWELWNEFNMEFGWRGTIATSIAMAQDARNIIKTAYPNAVILSPSVTNTYADQTQCDADPTCGQAFLASWLNQGGSDIIDVIAFHGYLPLFSSPGVYNTLISPELITSEYAILQNEICPPGGNCDLKPVWDTEASWGNNANINPVYEGSWLARHFLLEYSFGIARSFWYSFDNVAGNLGTLCSPAVNQNPPSPGQGVTDPNSYRCDGITQSVQEEVTQPDNSEALGQVKQVNPTVADAGLQYARVNRWLLGSTLSQPCLQVSVNPSIYSCTITRPSGYVGKILWLQSEGCLAPANSGAVYQQQNCQVTYPFINNFGATEQCSLAGSTSPIINSTITVTAQPILIDSGSACP